MAFTARADDATGLAFIYGFTRAKRDPLPKESPPGEGRRGAPRRLLKRAHKRAHSGLSFKAWLRANDLPTTPTKTTPAFRGGKR